MSSQPTLVYDVTEATFEQIVLNAPEDQVVVVDFWAGWCSPCRMLGPVLEKVIASHNGAAILAKVDVDQNQRLAMQFGIQGIPAVKIFQGGEIVGEFSGALPEAAVRQKLDPFIPAPDDEEFENAQSLYEGGALDLAGAQAKAILAEEPNHAGAKLLLAQIALDRQQFSEAEEWAKAIQINESGYDEAQGILNRLGFLQTCQGETDLARLDQRIAENPADLDARYQKAQCLAAQGQYQDAMEELLALLKKDKKYKDGAAKETMVRIFSIIGQRSKMADEYRDKLEWILY
ncbi:MAG: tetratricopeptide repeat protein [bacterium]|jgi:putative thioredoxin|nr:tetratricopeptide repeat protein [bacterium]